MALDPRIALGVQPLQVQSPMQGAQQALTLRQLMAGAAAQEARRDQYRMAQAQAAQQQQAQGRFMQALQQSGGQMTPELATLGMSAGYDPAQLQQLSGMSNWGRPKVAGQFETVGPDGRLMTMFRDEYGGTIGEGHTKPVKLQAQNLGGEVGFFNEYTGAEGAPRVAKTPEQTEIERLMVSRGIQPGSAQWNQVIGDYLLKKTTHAPAASTTVHNFIQPSTPGQETADKEFAKDFIEFATGGYADTMKGLQQLQEARRRIAADDSLTGPIRGALPDAVRTATNPQAVATRELVEEVVQRNLRLVLGAQFTEKEGERLIARAYNPRLSQQENLARVDRLIQQISAAAQAKLDAAQYFQQNGSLVGWQGRLPTMNDFDPVPPGDGAVEGLIGESGGARQSFADMPDPARHPGVTIRDNESGITYQSDGRSWKEVR